MAGLLNLEQVIELYGSDAFPIDEESIQEYLSDSDEKNQSLGHMLRAANDYAKGRPQDALAYLLRQRHEAHTLLVAVIAMIVWLRRIMKNPQAAAYDCIEYAEDAMAAGCYDLALEACSGAIFLDQAGDFEITKSPELTLRITRLYEQVARSMTSCKGLASGKDVDADERLRVALVVGNLVDHVVAYSRRVLNFARHLDRTKFDVRVYSTENLTARENPLFPFGIENGSSRDAAPVSVAALRELGVPVYFAPRDIPGRDVAMTCVKRMVEDKIDVALFQTGIASPIDWLVARLAPLPVKAGIHIGSSPFNTGFDLYFFDNPQNIEREEKFWLADMGERVVLNSGVDIELLRKSGVLSRAELNIPEQALLVGTVSNHLAERMSEDYTNIIIRALLRFPESYFLGVGIPPMKSVIERFVRAGVGDRVRFPGPVTMTSVVLKMMDIYACEFPVGGSESVKEAIACGIPVVAMRAGEGHAECAAANIVGDAFAVMDYDLSAYRKQLFAWIEHPEERQHAGACLAVRAQQCYSFSAYAESVMMHLLLHYQRKTSYCL